MNTDLLNLSKSISKYVVGMEGNISRKNKNSITIKASGAKINNITNDDFVDVDFYGTQLNNFDKKGSIELGFHLFLLSNFDIKYVSHTHPTNTLKILTTNKSKLFAEKRFFPDQVVFNGKKSCLVPYAKPGVDLTNSIKKSIHSFISEENFFPKLILLENHGIIVCGKTIDECTIITEICEKSAEIFLTQFEINYLSDSEINNLITDKNEIYRLSKV
jgi:L-fuculose-phosphate aldolase